jgi:transposase
MIPVPSGARVWLANGHTDMRNGFDGLALLVQETLRRDPHGGHLFVFRGRRGGLIKVLWHDGQGMCLFSKRLERGRFLWPSPLMALRRSRRPSLATCSKASTGGCRNRRGDRRPLADCGIVNHDTIASSQAHRLVIPYWR